MTSADRKMEMVNLRPLGISGIQSSRGLDLEVESNGSSNHRTKIRNQNYIQPLKHTDQFIKTCRALNYRYS